MRFISFVFVCLMFSCAKRQEVQPIPEYGLLQEFSEQIKPQTDLILRGYGVNNYLPRGYNRTNHVANFCVTYSLSKTRNDQVSLDEARRMVVFVVENLLQAINSNPTIASRLEVVPCSSDRVNLRMHFEDENRVDLGQGVASVYFSRGTIKYERHDLSKCTGALFTEGEYVLVLEEPYADALEIVKQQGGLVSIAKH